MNKDNFEGTIRSAVGQGEKILGQATNDRSTTAQGYYDDAAGKARSRLEAPKTRSAAASMRFPPWISPGCAMKSAS